MYEARGDEGYKSLQKTPPPGSICGMESERASSVTGHAGLDKQASLPPEAPAEVRPQSLSVTQPDFPSKRGKAEPGPPGGVPSHGEGQAWPGRDTSIPEQGMLPPGTQGRHNKHRS